MMMSMMSVGSGMEVFLRTTSITPTLVNSSATLFYDSLGINLTVPLQHNTDNISGQSLGIQPATGGTDAYYQDVSYSTVLASDYNIKDVVTATVRSNQSSTTNSSFFSSIDRGTWCVPGTPSSYALTTSKFFIGTTPTSAPASSLNTVSFSPTTNDMPIANFPYGTQVPSPTDINYYGAYPGQARTVNISGIQFYRF